MLTHCPSLRRTTSHPFKDISDVMQVYKDVEFNYVKAICDIKQEQVVEEYVGEVISVKRGKQRENKWYMIEATSPCWDGYIDSRFFGNETRFINHSCSPNLKSNIVVHLGQPVLVLTSLRNIEKNEILTYDYFPYADKITYNFFDGKCKCGSAWCRKR